MQQKIQVMLDLQNSMNTKVNPDWRNKNFEWYRAIWIECAEMLDHYGWKWWKKQDPDIDQVILELIDIWHFGLSILLLDGKSAAQIKSEIDDAIKNTKQTKAVSASEFPLELEVFVLSTLESKSFSVNAFVKVMNSIDLRFDQLYTGYVGKNVLNFFRQDNGYKEGSYQKVWGGREDNEHLVDLLAELNVSDTNFQDQLYKSLEARYTSLNP